MVDNAEDVKSILYALKFLRLDQTCTRSLVTCHDAQVRGPNRVLSPLRLTVLAAKSEDYPAAPKHLQKVRHPLRKERRLLVQLFDYEKIIYKYRILCEF